MKRLVENAGSTATLSRPRSLFVQIVDDRFSALACCRTPLSLMTRSAPAWVVTSNRPSGVKARPVGDGIAATSESSKPVGGTARTVAPVTSAAATKRDTQNDARTRSASEQRSYRHPATRPARTSTIAFQMYHPVVQPSTLFGSLTSKLRGQT